jgi:hypothetical protein
MWIACFVCFSVQLSILLLIYYCKRVATCDWEKEKANIQLSMTKATFDLLEDTLGLPEQFLDLITSNNTRGFEHSIPRKDGQVTSNGTQSSKVQNYKSNIKSHNRLPIQSPFLPPKLLPTLSPPQPHKQNDNRIPSHPPTKRSLRSSTDEHQLPSLAMYQSTSPPCPPRKAMHCSLK